MVWGAGRREKGGGHVGSGGLICGRKRAAEGKFKGCVRHGVAPRVMVL